MADGEDDDGGFQDSYRHALICGTSYNEIKVKPRRIKNHPRHRGVNYIRMLAHRDELLTAKYNAQDKYAVWESSSMLARGIRRGFDSIPMGPGSRVLWLGQDLADLSYIKDIVGAGGHIYATAENNVADNLPVEIVTRAATLTQFLGPHGPLVLGPIGDPVDALVMDLPWSQNQQLPMLKRVVTLIRKPGGFIICMRPQLVQDLRAMIVAMNRLGLTSNYVNMVKPEMVGYIVGTV